MREESGGTLVHLCPPPCQPELARRLHNSITTIHNVFLTINFSAKMKQRADTRSTRLPSMLYLSVVLEIRSHSQLTVTTIAEIFDFHKQAKTKGE